MKSLPLDVLLLLAFLSAPALGFYNDEPELFSQRPDPKKSSYVLTRVGPIGISMELIQPAFTMKVKSVEPGSPAATAGLKPGQIIESINGEKLADTDPRIQLGNLITKSEANGGKVVMMVADKKGAAAQEVVVQIQALGSYSDTWPLKCAKSDKIVRNFAEYLKTPGNDQGFGSLGMLFLLSTGDDADLDHVRKWARGISSEPRKGFHTWNAGYGHLALCEYYLRTGDKQVLPAIQAVVNNALKAENNNSWGNRAPIAGLSYGGGGGHLSASSVPLATFLTLAKMCGAKMPDEQFLRIFRHHARWAGRGNVPYGNNKPEGSYTDNGKNGALAYTLAAAARLTPDGEDSVYARGRDTNALFSFTSTSYMLHGHTGGGIGEIWRSSAMGLLHEKQPHLYRDFMNKRRWHYEMSRRFDGSFAILGGLRYDNTNWGAGYALTYTVPRKTLQLTGAPKSPHAVAFKLPDILWGTAEDNEFLSIDAIAYPDGTLPDFSKDSQETGGGMALLRVRGDTLTDEQLQRYMRHPTYVTRTYFIGDIAKRGEGFVLQMLGDADARMRRLGLDVIAYRGGTKELATPKVQARAFEMLADAEESWFVKEAALRVVALAPADAIVPHVDSLVPYLNHEEWWLQQSALSAVTPVVTDPRVYKPVLTALGELLKTNHLYNVTAGFRWGPIPEALRDAEPEIAAFAKAQFEEAYRAYVDFQHPRDDVEERINPGMREEIAKAITKLPGGYDVLFELAGQRAPGKALPYEALFLEADSSKFSPALQEAIGHIVKTKLIPRYIGNSRDYLLRERANEAVGSGFYYREPRVLGLVELYQKLGVHDYDWKDFGPKPTEMSWRYLTFDPPEKMAWDVPKARYRDVAIPKGSEDWTKPDFNPAAAGWRRGLQPFGATNGKLAGATIDGSRTHDRPSACKYQEFCRHDLPMKTLWDKETLLLRGTFSFPKLEEGYRYRFVMGGMSHVGAGEGFKAYVNGKPFFERPRGVGRREGGKPISRHIDKTWWEDFSGKEVNLAVISFMNIHRGVKHRHMTVWVQEMKLPPLNDDQIIGSATLLPMTSQDWQALQDPDDNDLDPNAGRFLWDGKVAPNAAALGAWKTVGYVNKISDFDPAKPRNAHRANLKAITIKPDGKTDQALMIWSGDTLMNLSSNQALKMTFKELDGKKYLFVEAGGFNTRHGAQWVSPVCVMQKAAD